MFPLIVSFITSPFLTFVCLFVMESIEFYSCMAVTWLQSTSNSLEINSGEWRNKHMVRPPQLYHNSLRRRQPQFAQSNFPDDKLTVFQSNFNCIRKMSIAGIKTVINHSIQCNRAIRLDNRRCLDMLNCQSNTFHQSTNLSYEWTHCGWTKCGEMCI